MSGFGFELPSGQVEGALGYLGCQADVLSLDPHSLAEVLDSILTVGRRAGVQVPGTDLLPASRRQRGPVPLPQWPPQRGPQVRRPDRDQPHAAHLRRPPRPGRQQDWRQPARQDTKTRGTPGMKKKVSTSSPTGSPTRKPVTTGKTSPACRARRPVGHAHLHHAP